ncbi:hypothetical protein LJC30_01360 [Odoribacter sp. OttesenSCG-928-L07]|nr:hypothetical protein [Odoribacter sp. OttesenSCG-928-L07]MDL2239926.1 hypothetical protein [Bacteroidales bacterium OttesenSCG-928-L14]MDL2240770.1 hypothetical protein [Bacteroidales bacterium OttesenSCG-928-K22]
MKKLILPLILIFFVSSYSFSQETNSTIKYSNITEVGYLFNPSSFNCELTTVSGICLNNRHALGVGLGFGVGNFVESGTIYCPVYLNYRFYFQNTTRRIKPHLNLAVGALLLKEQTGLYSTFTSGFKAGAFTLSGGLFFCMHNEMVRYIDDYTHQAIFREEMQYPLGLMIKLGLNF